MYSSRIIVGEIKIITIYSPLLHGHLSRRECCTLCKYGLEYFDYELRTTNHKTRDLWASFRPMTTNINLIINATEKILSINSRLVAPKTI